MDDKSADQTSDLNGTILLFFLSNHRKKHTRLNNSIGDNYTHYLSKPTTEEHTRIKSQKKTKLIFPDHNHINSSPYTKPQAIQMQPPQHQQEQQNCTV